MARKKPAGRAVRSDLAAAVWPAEELPFVREIHSHPFDDAPRLIFADWLEERGDPRAEFIRVQCQLAQLRIRDPAYPAVQARSEALIAEYHDPWVERYPKLPAIEWGIHPMSWWGVGWRNRRRHHFHRGFVAATEGSVTSIQRHARTLFDNLGMQQLSVRVASRSDAEALASMSELTRVEALLIDGLYLEEKSDIDTLLSMQFGPLRRLDLSILNLPPQVLASFLEREGARHLRQFGCAASRRLADTLLEWQHRDELDVLDFPFSEPGLLEFFDDDRLRPSEVVMYLGLDRDEILARCQGFEKAPALSLAVALQLTHLVLAAGRLLAHLTLPRHVTSLHLTGEMGDDAFDAMAQCSALGQVRELSIVTWGHLTDVGVTTLAKSPAARGLQTLHLAAKIRYRVVQALLESLPGLRRITLEETLLTGDQKEELRQRFAGVLHIE